MGFQQMAGRAPPVAYPAQLGHLWLTFSARGFRGCLLPVQADKEMLQRDLRGANASVSAIRKQTEGLQLEFDKLLDENKNLRDQLSLFDRKFSRGDDKKRS